MSQHSYYAPAGGLPPQSQPAHGRACFTTAYAVIPRGVMTDIVTSYLPGWHGMRTWVLARPMTGFAESFVHMIVELAPGGGSDTPEPEAGAEAVLFVVEGTPQLTLDGKRHALAPGGYAFVAPGSDWQITNPGGARAVFHWLRKAYCPAPGLDRPASFVTSDADTPPAPMPDTAGRWATTRFADPTDLCHDMHVNIVTLAPGASIPFAETHVMEHGLYVLQGRGVYQLNGDWVEVEASDYMWLRAFCPQACYAGGPGPFRYLLYKDVNRHMRLTLNAPH